MNNIEAFITVTLFVFAVGLCIGSFLNVVVLRAFSNESIVFPASKCPKCQTPLKWYHNIPVFSYLFLRGKCSYCKEKISIQYPMVELGTGILYLALFYKFGPTINTIFLMIISSIFMVISVTDIREKVVFDAHTYSLILIGLLYSFLGFSNLYSGTRTFEIGILNISLNNTFIEGILGIMVGALVMELLARFGILVAGTRAFGEGDSFIAAGLGAIFGWKYLFTVLLYGFLLQIIVAIPVFLRKLYRQKDFQTLISFVSFFVFAFIFGWLSNLGLTQNITIYSVSVIALGSLGFYACRRILGSARTENNVTYMPYGPAMVIGALVFMFTAMA